MNSIRRTVLKEVLDQLIALDKRLDELHREEFKAMAALPDAIEGSIFGARAKIPLHNMTQASLSLERAVAHVAAAIVEKDDESCSA